MVAAAWPQPPVARTALLPTAALPQFVATPPLCRRYAAYRVGVRDTAQVGHTRAMGNGKKPTDSETLAHIRDLVAEEKALRAQLQHRDISESEEHDRLRRVEVELDQCWDLLRQRRALRETGGDPREARVRPADQVEGYLG